MITVERAGGGTFCGCGGLGNSAGGCGTFAASEEPAFAEAGAGETVPEASAFGEGGIQSSSSVHSDIAAEVGAGAACEGPDFLRRKSNTIGTTTTAPSTPTMVTISNGSMSLPVSCFFSSAAGVASAGWAWAWAADSAAVGAAGAAGWDSGVASAWGAVSLFGIDRRGPETGKDAGLFSDCEAVAGAG